MTKKTFDLGVAITVGVIVAMTLPRLWSTKRLLVGPQSGMGYELARGIKVITA